jgi:nicotinamidase-related amidase
VNAEGFEDHGWRDVVPPEILDIYRFYRRETFVGPRPALLAIDLYRLVFEGGPRPVTEVVATHPSSCGVHAWNAIAPLQELFALARSRGFPVFYTTQETRKEVDPANVRATHRAGRVAADAYLIREEFRPEPGDVIIYKERASAFFGTPLIAHLKHRGVESLIVCGGSTSGCVRASVVDAYSYGFHTVMVEECCFDRSPLSHAINLFDVHHKYADVMHLAELKRHLATQAEG